MTCPISRLSDRYSASYATLPVIRYAGLSDREKRVLELEENVKRKALTPVEESRLRLALVEADKEREAESEIRGVMPRNSPGRPVDPLSDRATAERLGESPKSIRRAREHIAAVEDDPARETMTQAEALRDYRESRDQTPAQPVDRTTRTPKGRGAGRMESGEFQG